MALGRNRTKATLVGSEHSHNRAITAPLKNKYSFSNYYLKWREATTMK